MISTDPTIDSVGTIIYPLKHKQLASNYKLCQCILANPLAIDGTGSEVDPTALVRSRTIRNGAAFPYRALGDRMHIAAKQSIYEESKRTIIG